MTPFVWMFISSYEKLRSFLINSKTITSLIQLEYSGFEGATVPICTFTLENKSKKNFRGSYIKLSEFRGAVNQAPKALEAIKNPDCGYSYHASAEDFKKIPGSPIAYWANDYELIEYKSNQILANVVDCCKGLDTGENNRFLRLWHEISKNLCTIMNKNGKWFPYNKGGDFRKWYGNREYLIIKWTEKLNQ
jgi:type II restriction/modification system DNA methylase subunit YeeA